MVILSSFSSDFSTLGSIGESLSDSSGLFGDAPLGAFSSPSHEGIGSTPLGLDIPDDNLQIAEPLLEDGLQLGQGNGLTGQYFDNKDLTELALIRTDATVDFDWQKGSPDPLIGKNTFSVRWSGQIQPLYDEEYTFYTQANDGVRLWVNGEQLIDEWNNVRGKGKHQGSITLEAGERYDIELEYYDYRGKAFAQLSWSSDSQIKQVIPTAQLYSTSPTPVEIGSGTGLLGEYFDNQDLTESKLVRTDATINFDWQKESPDPLIDKDTFSVRWTGQVQPLYDDEYTFYTQANDGVRLSVNGAQLIDEWNNAKGKGKNQGSITLEAGERYDIELEYYDYRGKAFSQLLWSSENQVKEIIPTSQLYVVTPREELTVIEEFTINGVSPIGSDWNSPIMTIDDIIYITYLDAEDNIWVAQQKPGEELVQTQIFESVTLRHDGHHDASLGIDEDGYIHVVGNMHNAPLNLHEDNPYQGYSWQYWVSQEPHNIESFEFMGDNPARSIPGYEISYAFFAYDQNNELYVAFRGDSGFDRNYVPGQAAGQIARYDAETQSWEALGEQVGNADERSTQSVIWEEAGVPDPFFGDGYQGFKPRIYFDDNNWMHLTYTVNINEQVNPENPERKQHANTSVFYAVSQDGGETFTQADGTAIPLPMTSSNADLVFHTDTPSIYNLNHLAVDSNGIPVVTWTDQESDNNWSWWDEEEEVWQEATSRPVDGWMGRLLIDSEDVLTLITERQIFRSIDRGETGELYYIPGMSITRTKFDYKYFQETNQIRLFVQSENDGTGRSKIRVLTLDFS